MNRIFVLLALAVLSLAQETPPGAGAPQRPGGHAQPDDETEGQTPTINVEVGGQATSVDGVKHFGFQAYRDVPQGFFVRRFDYRATREDNPLQFSLRSLDLLQHDMTLNTGLESVGKFRIGLDFWSFSRYWSDRDRSVLLQASPGYFVVSDQMRSSLEAVLPDRRSGGTCAAWSGCALVTSNVAAAGELTVRSDRQRASVTQAYHLPRGLTLQFDFMQERRHGDRLMSEGAYSRQDTPIGVVFEMSGQELWEPTNYRTREFGAELRYTSKRLIAAVQYTGSLFHDDLGSIVWQNPYRITPAQAALNGNSYTDGAQDRFRFAETQASLPPSNQAHTFTGSLFVFLPHASKVSALVSWSRWTQNDAFLPFTINPAITVTNSLVAANPITVIPKVPAGVPLTSLDALPQRSLDGLMHVLNQDYVATSRIARPLELTLHYSDYDLHDLTPPILFPGYAAYGNSFWRTTRYGQPPTAPQNPAGDVDVAIQRLPKSFRQQRILLQGAVKPTPDLTWKTEARREFWRRDNRPVHELSEGGILSSISYAPKNPFYFSAGVAYLDRKPDAYDPGHLESLFLRQFDEARRVRKQGNAMFSLDLPHQAAFSASWYYSGDRYDTAFYGLHQQKSNGVTADLTFNVSESFAFFTGYGYDRIGYDYLLSASLGYLWVNSWSRDTRDGVHAARVGFSGSIARTRFEYSASLGLTLARTRINTINPNIVQPDAVDYARAYPFPDVKSEFSEMRAEASYRFTRKITAGGHFLFEPYHLSDFAYSDLSPYDPAGLAQETDGRRYIFMGSGPSSYTGKLLALFIRYSF